MAATRQATGHRHPGATQATAPDAPTAIRHVLPPATSSARPRADHGDGQASTTRHEDGDSACGERLARWLFTRDPAQVRCARRRVREELAAWDLAAHADLVELVVSELVTNAVRHGDGKVEVRLARAGGELRIGVHDDGDGRPVVGQPGADDEHGRGLPLIGGLIEPHSGAITVTADEDGPGKTVHVMIILAASGEGGR